MKTSSLTVDDFFRLLKEAVMYSPPNEHKCKQLQTFAVLESMIDLNTANLGKTSRERDKNYFFSREWAQKKFSGSDISYEYPAVIVFEKSIDNIKFDENFTHMCYNFQVAVLDEYIESCVDCDYCTDRTRNDIFLDTEDLLIKTLKYLHNVVYARIDGDSSTDGFYNVGFLDQLVTEAEIPGYEIIVPETRKYKLSIRQSNELKVGVRYDIGADKLHGTMIDISFCSEKCFDGDFNFNIRSYPTESLQKCCS